MCQFCVQHGDGKKWYLEASTYSQDLDQDLKRREYLIDFVRGFGDNRDWMARRLPLFDRAPAPIRGVGAALFTRTMKKNHYGQPVPIEECEQIFDIATSIVRLPCPCRYHAGKPDEGYCLAITTKPIDAVLEEAFASYDAGPDVAKFQRLTKAEALQLLRRAEDQGLMHSVWTFVSPFIGAICNCNLDSGCLAMDLTVTHDLPVMFKGEYIALVDADACLGCTACVERCPFGAIAMDPATQLAVIDREACYGCGTCRSGCAFDAIALRDKTTGAVLAVPVSSQVDPGPATIVTAG